MRPRLPRTVHIHYLRPPDRLTVFVQELVHDDGSVKVTLARDVDFDPPLTIRDQVVLEKGSDAVWFTFPGVWHDIGLFHRADGTFTGTYANVITPCVFQPGGDWETTDLFLDVWIPARGGEPLLLDQDELYGAEEAGAVEAGEARRAREEAARILEGIRTGAWPPPVVDAWGLERARGALSYSSTRWAEQSRSRST